LSKNDTFTQGDIDNGLIKYSHDGSETATDSFGFTVEDGLEDGVAALSGTFNITINNINDAPVIEKNDGITVDEGSENSVITSSMLSCSDEESGSNSIIYTLSSTTIHGILSKNGTTLSSGDSFTQQDIDDGIVKYSHDGSETTSDSFDFTVGDGELSQSGSFDIVVNPVDDPPVLGVASSCTYNEGDPPVAIAGTITITDVDNVNLKSAEVRIVNGYKNGEDLLEYDGSAILNAVWDSESGCLKFDGEASIEDYIEALKSVKFSNSATDLSTESRSFGFIVSDGIFESELVTVDADLVGKVGAPQFSVEGGKHVLPFDLTITVPDSGATIRYTTDGSDPSPTNGELYVDGVTIVEMTELKAIAYKEGMNTSDISSVSYDYIFTYEDDGTSVTIDTLETLLAPANLVIPAIINGLPVTKIRSYAFASLPITTVIIPDSVTDIGIYAFADCDQLNSVTMGSGVVNIGEGAFKDCVLLPTIEMPAALGNLGAYAFKGCSSLTEARFSTDAPLIDTSKLPFDSVDSTFKVYYKSGTNGWDDGSGPEVED
jgi:hypothetical protein